MSADNPLTEALGQMAESAMDKAMSGIAASLAKIAGKATDPKMTAFEGLLNEISAALSDVVAGMEKPDGDAAIAKAITDALASANAQNESADIFREVGKSAPADGDAFGQIKGLADGYVTSGDVATFEQGIAKAATDHPDLYNRYLTEKGR